MRGHPILTAAVRDDWGPVLIVMLVLGIASLVPVGGIPPVLAAADEAIHCLMYAVLALATARSASRTGSSTRAALILGFTVAVTFGGLMEWLQALVGRDPSRTDLMANVIGAVVGALAWTFRRAAGAESAA